MDKKTAELLSYNTSFVNSWYGIVPFPTSEYAFIRKKRNELFKRMNKEQINEELKIDDELLDLLVKQPILKENPTDVDMCAPYYIIPYKKCLEVVSSFLTKSTSNFVAVSLQEQNYTKHSFDAITEAINKIIPKENIQIISNYVVAGNAYPALTSIFKINGNKYTLIEHNNKGSINNMFKGDENKNTPIEYNRNQMLIFDVGAEFKYKKINCADDNGRPCGIVRFDTTDKKTILHINCHLPNPSALSSSNTILSDYENGTNEAMTLWAKAVIDKINVITSNLNSYYDTPIPESNDIIVFFTGDMNDSYGVLRGMLEKNSSLMINTFPITIKFDQNVIKTCCANSNSTTATFTNGKEAGSTTTTIKDFTNNGDEWEKYQDGWDNEVNYKFQGDNIGVGYLTGSNNTLNPYEIKTIKYNDEKIDTTYSDHSPVESTITFKFQIGGRRRRKTKRTNKRTHKKRTNKKRKSRK
jgi:hypothetical protein